MKIQNVMEYNVYILKSEKTKRFYTGLSSNPDLRLEYHNRGMNVSTRNGVPWVSCWLSHSMDKKEAMMLEKKIKKRGAGRFLADLGID